MSETNLTRVSLLSNVSQRGAADNSKIAASAFSSGHEKSSTKPIGKNEIMQLVNSLVKGRDSKTEQDLRIIL